MSVADREGGGVPAGLRVAVREALPACVAVAVCEPDCVAVDVCEPDCVPEAVAEGVTKAHETLRTTFEPASPTKRPRLGTTAKA